MSAVDDEISGDGENNAFTIAASNPTGNLAKCSSNTNIPQQKKALGSVFVLDNVLLPLLRYDMSTKTIRESNLRSSLHLSCAKKFVSRVCRFIDQQEKGVKFVVPDFADFETDDQMGATETSAMNSQTSIKRIERLVSEWNIVLTRSIEAELLQQPNNDFPMGEVDFWRRRHVVLSDIMEQIKSQNMQRFINTLKASAGSSQSRKMQDNISVVVKLAVEAADNAKFLSTLERHLRTLSDGTLSSMITAIPSLVDGMRMVWTVSRHYNRDERMSPLMERVGNQIASRVKSFVKPQDLRCDDLTAVKEKVQQSKQVLETWRSSYMVTRERIEDMGTNQRRWEFDRVLLFEKTDHMAYICVDLLEIIESVSGLTKFFSPHLLAITGENKEVNNIVSRVDSLTDIIVNSQIDVFDVCNKSEWQIIRQKFHDTAAMTEKSAEGSIERAFQQLRSSESAYALVLKLKGLGTRTVILEARHRDILDRYELELDQAIFCFSKYYKDNPHLCRRNRKTPGVVAWANDIYLRTKKVIVLFQKHGDILNTTRGEKVKRKYLNFAKEIDQFKVATYEEWCNKVKELCQYGLQRSLLTRDNHTVHDGGISLTSLDSDNDTSIESHQSESFDRVKTNFSDEVRIAIAEAKHFDSMGYHIPETLTYLTLQQHIYDRYLIELEKLVKVYNSLHMSMSPIEFTILRDHVKRMNDVLEPSFTYLNWSSQGVLGFITKANNAIDTFKSFLEETRKHSTAAEALVNSIECESFVDIKIPLVDVGTTIDAIEKTAEEKGKIIEKSLKSMSPLILKIIMAISQTNSTSSTLLSSFQSYFTYWEKRLYNAIVKLMLRSMVSAFFILTTHVKMAEEDPSTFLPPNNMKSLDAKLFMRRFIRVFLSTINQYGRWKCGSCVEAISANDDSNDKGRAFSYLDDVSRDPSLYSLVTALTDQCQRYNAKLRR